MCFFHSQAGYVQRTTYIVVILILAACSSSPKKKEGDVTRNDNIRAANTVVKASATPIANSSSILPKANSGQGGYYQDDGPGENIPSNLASANDPIPTMEPYSRSGNKPYQVFGKTYTPMNDTTTPFKQRGLASWYGKKFHGKRTSSGEPYDMYKITAAHPTLPIPSYARVTNLTNGKQIIVRINDRGPFHSNRIMDLSYTAALKLDYLGKGSVEIEVERLLPEDIVKMSEKRPSQIVQVEETKSTDDTIISTKLVEREDIELEKLISQQVKEMPSNSSNETVQTPTIGPNSTSNKESFYLQFAVFSVRTNAEQMIAKLTQRMVGIVSDIGCHFEIVEQDKLFRVQCGPYVTRSQAASIVEYFTMENLKPLVLQR